jgi:hypothetical protein
VARPITPRASHLPLRELRLRVGGGECNDATSPPGGNDRTGGRPPANAWGNWASIPLAGNAGSAPIGRRSEKPSVIGRVEVSAPGGNRDAADRKEGGKVSTERNRIVRGRGGVPGQKDEKEKVRRTRGRIGNAGKCRSGVGSEENKNENRTRHQKDRKREGRKPKEAGGPPGRKTPRCSEKPDAAAGSRKDKAGTPRHHLFARVGDPSLTSPSPASRSSCQTSRRDAAFPAVLPDAARTCSLRTLSDAAAGPRLSKLCPSTFTPTPCRRSRMTPPTLHSSAPMPQHYDEGGNLSSDYDPLPRV